jgi:hypothetical protein
MALAMVKEPQVGNTERSRRPRPTPTSNGHRVALRAVPQAKRARPDVVSEASLDAPIVTVYQAPDGLFHHAWCHQTLEYHGRRARLEVDFFCLRCVEHVALPESVLPRIPVRVPFAQA